MTSVGTLFFLIIEEMLSVFLIEHNVCGEFVIYGLYYIELGSIWPFSGEFYHKYVLNFVNSFFCIYWDYDMVLIECAYESIWPWVLFAGRFFLSQFQFQCLRLISLFIFSISFWFGFGRYFSINSSISFRLSISLTYCCSVIISCLTLCNSMNCSKADFLFLQDQPGVCSNSCPLSQWCHPTILSRSLLLSQSFPASESFSMSWLFTLGGQSVGASA